MYEDVTYESILKRMLERTPEGIDKREGSIIYDALAPAAVELQNMYIQFDWILRQMFADTSEREYLVQRCAEWGLVPYPASKAVLKGVFNMDVPVGCRFSLGSLNYTAVGKISNGEYRMECETAGTIGNKSFGALIPILYLNGLTKAELTEVLEEGIDEETTEALRKRFLIKVQKPSTSGNKYDYYNWAMECEGVGAAKIFPLADGPGTVKVVVASGNMAAAGAELIAEVAEHIESVRPIGAAVKVLSAVEKPIDAAAAVRITPGMNIGVIQQTFEKAVSDYLHDNAFGLTYVSLSRIGALLLDTPGVEDYMDLKLNGQPALVNLLNEEIAVAGTMRLEVSVAKAAGR